MYISAYRRGWHNYSQVMRRSCNFRPVKQWWCITPAVPSFPGKPVMKHSPPCKFDGLLCMREFGHQHQVEIFRPCIHSKNGQAG